MNARCPRLPMECDPSVARVKRQAVKRHHHKHNLKHRYEFLRTLGEGTYGRVKKAVDRSGRTVREPSEITQLLIAYDINHFKYFKIMQYLE